MSLATRCSACGTIFRVVHDQLKISDGWVRCGRCDVVFDALDGMVDLEQQPLAAGLPETDRPGRIEPEWSAPAEQEPVDIHPLLARQDDAGNEIDDYRVDADPPAADQYSIRDEPLDINLDDAQAIAPIQAPSSAIDGPAPSAVDQAAAAAATLPPTPPPIFPAAGGVSMAPLRPPASPPGFMRRADREAHWTSPAMRAALIGSSLILLLMLVLQVVYHQRDAIAARSPLAADWLGSACARWNCSIEPPRNIREVTIENSALTKLADQPQAARLSLMLRNRSSDDLMMPAIELSLSDFEGRLIARKALLPADLQIDPPVLAGNSDLPVQIVVSTGERRIAGYSVELFYP